MRVQFSIYFSLILALMLVFAVSMAEASGASDKASLCASCHGQAGISDSPMVPNLAGQKKDYLVKQLNDFRAGKRNNAIMMSMAQNLTDEDISELATYFSELPSSADKSAQH